MEYLMVFRTGFVALLTGGGPGETLGGETRDGDTPDGELFRDADSLGGECDAGRGANRPVGARRAAETVGGGGGGVDGGRISSRSVRLLRRAPIDADALAEARVGTLSRPSSRSVLLSGLVPRPGDI